MKYKIQANVQTLKQELDEIVLKERDDTIYSRSLSWKDLLDTMKMGLVSMKIEIGSKVSLCIPTLILHYATLPSGVKAQMMKITWQLYFGTLRGLFGLLIRYKKLRGPKYLSKDFQKKFGSELKNKLDKEIANAKSKSRN